jgi:hypothetical protein
MGSLLGGGRSDSPAPSVAPKVTAEPAPTPSTNAETMRRAGRASMLLSTSSQGILGRATTGRQQLLSS